MKAAFYWFWQVLLVLSFGLVLSVIYTFLTVFNQFNPIMFVTGLVLLFCAIYLIWSNDQALKQLRTQCEIAEHRFFARLDIAPHAVVGIICTSVAQYYDAAWFHLILLASPLIAGIITLAFRLVVIYELAAKLPARNSTKKEE